MLLGRINAIFIAKSTNFRDLARIEADKAEIWHTPRFLPPETEYIN